MKVYGGVQIQLQSVLTSALGGAQLHTLVSVEEEAAQDPEPIWTF